MCSVALSLLSEKSGFKALFYFIFFKDYDLNDINEYVQKDESKQ